MEQMLKNQKKKEIWAIGRYSLSFKTSLKNGIDKGTQSLAAFISEEVFLNGSHNIIQKTLAVSIPVLNFI